MRHRDQNKIRALREATIDIVNRDGFATSSIHKIAKQAGVSPATLYVYHANKDELLVATFMELKLEMSAYLMAEFDAALPIRQNLFSFWQRLFHYVQDHADQYHFMDQFTYSPFIKQADGQVLEQPYLPLYKAIDDAIAQGEIAKAPREMLLAFILSPPVFMASSRLSKGFKATAKQLESAFLMAWKAITP